MYRYACLLTRNHAHLARWGSRRCGAHARRAGGEALCASERAIVICVRGDMRIGDDGRAAAKDAAFDLDAEEDA